MSERWTAHEPAHVAADKSKLVNYAEEVRQWHSRLATMGLLPGTALRRNHPILGIGRHRHGHRVLLDHRSRRLSEIIVRINQAAGWVHGNVAYQKGNHHTQDRRSLVESRLGVMEVVGLADQFEYGTHCQPRSSRIGAVAVCILGALSNVEVGCAESRKSQPSTGRLD